MSFITAVCEQDDLISGLLLAPVRGCRPPCRVVFGSGYRRTEWWKAAQTHSLSSVLVTWKVHSFLSFLCLPPSLSLGEWDPICDLTSHHHHSSSRRQGGRRAQTERAVTLSTETLTSSTSPCWYHPCQLECTVVAWNSMSPHKEAI